MCVNLIPAYECFSPLVYYALCSFIYFCVPFTGLYLPSTLTACTLITLSNHLENYFSLIWYVQLWWVHYLSPAHWSSPPERSACSLFSACIRPWRWTACSSPPPGCWPSSGAVSPAPGGDAEAGCGAHWGTRRRICWPAFAVAKEGWMGEHEQEVHKGDDGHLLYGAAAWGHWKSWDDTSQPKVITEFQELHNAVVVYTLMSRKIY